jgi:hypothetical protein
MNPLRSIGALVALSGLSFYVRHLPNQAGPSDFFWTIAGASVGLAGVWLFLWPAPRAQHRQPPKKCV